MMNIDGEKRDELRGSEIQRLCLQRQLVSLAPGPDLTCAPEPSCVTDLCGESEDQQNIWRKNGGNAAASLGGTTFVFSQFC